jgi:ubiquinone/menaquinone biosynthesis C-methylase UbiE
MASEKRQAGESGGNIDRAVVADFGNEWHSFDQSALSSDERQQHFDAYFAVFPWDSLPAGAVGFDAGCGTGRWALLAARRVGQLHCVDPSSAIEVARRNLAHQPNCVLHQASVADMPFADESMDFGYSLGVLHHIPSTERGIVDCVRKLKRGAPLLLYLYYAFDNQPAWFRGVWKVSDLARQVISRLPYGLKHFVSQVIATLVYWPLARAAKLAEKAGAGVHSWPLSVYRHRSFYSMRTDALDRFGTKLERRFSRAQIQKMMENAGLERVRFSPRAPFWCAVGFRK